MPMVKAPKVYAMGALEENFMFAKKLTVYPQVAMIIIAGICLYLAWTVNVVKKT